MRFITVQRLAAGFFVALATGAAAEVMKYIDLDAPGVLERLKVENSDHFRRVSAVYEASKRMNCNSRDFREFVREKFGANDAACGGLQMTLEYPANRSLSFELEKTRYSIAVTVVPDEKLQPPRNAN